MIIAATMRITLREMPSAISVPILVSRSIKSSFCFFLASLSLFFCTKIEINLKMRTTRAALVPALAARPARARDAFAKLEPEPGA